MVSTAMAVNPDSCPIAESRNQYPEGIDPCPTFIFALQLIPAD
jgi:hypothetical protein